MSKPRPGSRPQSTADADPPAAVPWAPDDVQKVIFDHISDAVFATDPANRVTYWSGSAERLFGYPASEVVGRPFGELLGFETAGPDDEREFTEELSAGRTWRGRGTVRLRDGNDMWVESIVQPIVEAGRVVGRVSVSRDISASVEARRGIDTVVRLLVEQGPVPTALDAILGELEARMGFRFLSIYLTDAKGLRLGAQRGYATLPEHVAAGTGVIGRVCRTRHPALIADVRSDPDYVPADPEIVGIIAVPLLGDEEMLGVLAIETAKPGGLTAGDLRVAVEVADRLSTALVRHTEQEALRDRVRLFSALSAFAGVANSILDSERLAAALVEAAGAVVPSDTIVITTLDRADGTYRVRAVRGLTGDVIGTVIEPGDGNTGRAIAERVVVTSDHHARAQYSSSLRDHVRSDSMYGIAVPLVREDTVLGVISVGRGGPDATFSEAEREVIALLGSQAALALANASLMEEVSALAIRDGLTGLHNRRHFDTEVELAIARYKRHGSGGQLAAIMFDLDHFGRFNSDNGHLAGDAMLRLFGRILRERLRSTDLVARYGGEEFVAILGDAGLEDAVRLADAIRLELESRSVPGPAGVELRATVSAGCAAIDAADATRESLIGKADAGLFKAKRAGRNRVVAG